MALSLNSLERTFKFVHFEQYKNSFLFTKVHNIIEVYDTLNINTVKVICLLIKSSYLTLPNALYLNL